MGKERGWVHVSVQTYQSHRSSSSSQRVFHQEYTVDESGATLNAISRTSDVDTVMHEATNMASQSSSVPTTSIFIRDWKVPRAPPPAGAAGPRERGCALTPGPGRARP